MRNAIIWLAAAAICAAAGAQHGAAADPTPSHAVQLERLNSTLERIADALTRQTRLDVLVRRVEMSAGRVAEAEKLLREAQEERERFEGEREQLQQQLEILRESDGAETDLPAGQVEMVVRQMESRHAAIMARLRDLPGRIAALENRLTEARVDHDQWQAYLDRLISEL